MILYWGIQNLIMYFLPFDFTTGYSLLKIQNNHYHFLFLSSLNIYGNFPEINISISLVTLINDIKYEYHIFNKYQCLRNRGLYKLMLVELFWLSYFSNKTKKNSYLAIHLRNKFNSFFSYTDYWITLLFASSKQDFFVLNKVILQDIDIQLSFF